MAKEKIDYFKHFSEVSDLALQQAKLLQKFLTDYNCDDIINSIEEMHALEHAADMKRGAMTEQLIKDFLPPIDRDDIIILADRYDTVCDSIDDVMLHFYMYNITECRPSTEQIAEKIVSICEELKKLTDELKGFSNPERLISHVIKVNDIEEEGDKIYLTVMNYLFTDKNTSYRDLVAWENIYTSLEDCFDACENTADEIRNVIIKNS